MCAPSGLSLASRNLPAQLRSRASVITPGSPSRFFNQHSSDEQVDMNVLSSSNSFQQPAAPSLETIDPAFHGVLIPAQHLDGNFVTPTIIAEWLHRRRLQFLSCHTEFEHAT
jgi:hypothetical protein